MKDENKEIRNNDEGEEKGSVLREILSWVEVLVAAFLIAMLCNNFVIANSTVPSGSMENTIMTGDRVVGLRLSYSLFGEPERGDIAIFRFGWICRKCHLMGENPAPDTCPKCGASLAHPKTLYYVKRVIGLPGDKIEIKADGSCKQSDLKEVPDGLDAGRSDDSLVTAAVYVNGEKLEEDYLKDVMLYTGDLTFEVPEDSYFFLGDNRNNSADSRYWNYSYITKDNVIAKVLFRYWPNPTGLS